VGLGRFSISYLFIRCLFCFSLSISPAVPGSLGFFLQRQHLCHLTLLPYLLKIYPLGVLYSQLILNSETGILHGCVNGREMLQKALLEPDAPCVIAKSEFFERGLLIDFRLPNGVSQVDFPELQHQLTEVLGTVSNPSLPDGVWNSAFFHKLSKCFWCS
jgi:hypothetical protein